jgi:hypothetical protein
VISSNLFPNREELGLSNKQFLIVWFRFLEFQFFRISSFEAMRDSRGINGAEVEAAVALRSRVERATEFARIEPLI